MHKFGMPIDYRIRGFTLIEVMTIVGLVGILVAIALPNYSGYMQSSRRSSAKLTLLQMHARQENHFANAKIYANTGPQLGYPPAPFYLNPEGDSSANQTDNSVYKVTISRPTNFTYLLTATAIGKQAKDTRCASYTINEQGTRGATSADCW